MYLLQYDPERQRRGRRLAGASCMASALYAMSLGAAASLEPPQTKIELPPIRVSFPDPVSDPEVKPPELTRPLVDTKVRHKETPRPREPEQPAPQPAPQLPGAELPTLDAPSLTDNGPGIEVAPGDGVRGTHGGMRGPDTNERGMQPAPAPRPMPRPTPAERISGDDPEYPRGASREGIEGTVVLELDVDAHGNVVDVRVVQGVDRRLDKAAADAARGWHYKPATRHGAPIATVVKATYTFRLQD